MKVPITHPENRIAPQVIGLGEEAEGKHGHSAPNRS
jgi:hypothetical protein